MGKPEAEHVHVLRKLGEFGVPPTIANPLACALAETSDLPKELLHRERDGGLEGDERVGGELTSRFVRWAIRDDDLKLIAGLSAALQAFGDPTFWGHLDPHSPQFFQAVASITVSSFAFIAQVKKKGAWLEPRQHAVLLALKARGPVTLGDLAAFLQLNKGETANWDDGSVQEDLASLQAVRLKDGTTVSFVTCGSDGRWTAAGV